MAHIYNSNKLNKLYKKYMLLEEEDGKKEPIVSPIVFPMQAQTEVWNMTRKLCRIKLPGRLHTAMIKTSPQFSSLITSVDDEVLACWNPFKKNSFIELKRWANKLGFFDNSSELSSDQIHLEIVNQFMNEKINKKSFQDDWKIATKMNDLESELMCNMNGNVGAEISSQFGHPSNEMANLKIMMQMWRGIRIRLLSSFVKIHKGINPVGLFGLYDLRELAEKPVGYIEHGVRSLVQALPNGVCYTRFEFVSSNNSMQFIWNSDVVLFNFELEGTKYWTIKKSYWLDHMISFMETTYALEYLKCEKPQFADIIQYMNDLIFDITIPYSKKVKISSALETLCLQMVDVSSPNSKSSWLPIIDTLIGFVENEGVQIVDGDLASALKDPRMSNILKLMDMINKLPMEYRPVVGALHKNSLYQIDTVDKGLTKYTKRTSRDWNTQESNKMKLKLMLRKKFIFGYAEKTKNLPMMHGVNDAGMQLIQELQDCITERGFIANEFVKNYMLYENIMLDTNMIVPEKVNVESRLNDKACAKFEFKKGENSVKELIEFLQRQNPDPDVDYILQMLESEDSTVRVVKVIDKDFPDMTPGFIVRLCGKEREQKDFRFYGVGSYDLKLMLSIYMEMVKKVCKFIDGQMLTKSKTEREKKLHDLAQNTRDPNVVTLMADISGHNQSERPDNMNPILEEIERLYGFNPGHLTKMAYVFGQIDVIFEHEDSDYLYYSKGQKGAIEGWMNPLWCLQSSLIMSIINNDYLIDAEIEMSYSDDMLQDMRVKTKDLTAESMDAILMNVKEGFQNFGFMVKFSQTCISDKRATLLKKTYVDGIETTTEFKRLLALSSFTSELSYNDFYEIDSNNSSFASMLENSQDNQLLNKYRWLRLIEYTIEKFAEFVYTYHENLLSEEILKVLTAEKLVALGINRDKPKAIARIQKINAIELIKEELVTSKELRLAYYCFLIMPTSIQGLGVIPLLFASVSGFSDSFVKRVDYISGIVTNYPCKETRFMNSYIYSSIEYNRLQSICDMNYPIVGKRDSPTVLLAHRLANSIKRSVTNANQHLKIKINNRMVRRALELDKESMVQADTLKLAIITTFKKSFNFRMANKFVDSSFRSYIDYILKKFDSSQTVLKFIGNENNLVVDLFNCGSHHEKITVDTNFRKPLTQELLINMRNEYYKRTAGVIYNDVEEVSLVQAFKLSSSPDVIMEKIPAMHVENKGFRKFRSYRLNSGIRPKYSSKSTIDWYFPHYLNYKMFDLARYTLWLIEDQKLNANKDFSIILKKLANFILSEYTMVRIEDLEKNIALPLGGQILHRLDNSGFKESSNIRTLMALAALFVPLGLQTTLMNLGTSEHNVNVELASAFLIMKAIYLEDAGLDFRFNVSFEDHTVNLIRDARTKLDLQDFDLPTDLIENLMDIPNSTTQQTFILASKLLRSGLNVDEMPVLCIDEKEVLSSDMITLCRRMSNYAIEIGVRSVYQLDNKVIRDFLNQSGFGMMNTKEFFDRFFEAYTLNTSIQSVNQVVCARHAISVKYLKKYQNSEDKKYWAFVLFLINTCLNINLQLIDKKNNTYVVTCDAKTSILNYQKYWIEFSQQLDFSIANPAILELIMPDLSMQYMRGPQVIPQITNICDHVTGEYVITSATLLSIPIEERYTLNPDASMHESVNISYEKMHLRHFTKTIMYELRKFADVFSSLCVLRAHIASFESSTGSGMYHTAIGLMNHFKSKRVADVAAGRGDFHRAMNELRIDHVSIQRTDAYNSLYSEEGMIRKKGFNAFNIDHLEEYLGYDLFLYDISYAKEFEEAENTILELVSMGKEVVLRVNQFPFEKFTYKHAIWDTISKTVYYPSSTIFNAGFLYLHLCKANKFESTTGIGFGEFKFNLTKLAMKITRNYGKLSQIRPYSDKSYEEISTVNLRKAINAETPEVIDHESVNQRIKILYGTVFREFALKNPIMINRKMHDFIRDKKLNVEVSQCRLLVTENTEDKEFVMTSKDSLGSQIAIQSKALMKNEMVYTDDPKLSNPCSFITDFVNEKEGDIDSFLEMMNLIIGNGQQRLLASWTRLLTSLDLESETTRSCSVAFGNYVNNMKIQSYGQSLISKEELYSQVKFVAKYKCEGRHEVAMDYLCRQRIIKPELMIKLLKSERKLVTRLRQLEARIKVEKISEETKASLRSYNSNPSEFESRNRRRLEKTNEGSVLALEEFNSQLSTEDQIENIKAQNPWISALLGCMVNMFEPGDTSHIIVDEEEKQMMDTAGITEAFAQLGQMVEIVDVEDDDDEELY